MRRELKNRDHNHGSTIWHLVVADYFSAKSLVFFLALVYMASFQLGVLKILGDTQPEQKPVEKVEILLNGDGTLLISRQGKYVPITKEEVRDSIKGKDVTFHTAEVVTAADYGVQYASVMSMMGEARGITPGKAINIITGGKR